MLIMWTCMPMDIWGQKYMPQELLLLLTTTNKEKPMIEKIEKISDRLAVITTTNGLDIFIESKQLNWIKVSARNAAVRKVQSDLLKPDLKCSASAALFFEKISD